MLGLFRVPTSAEEEREKEIVMDGYMLMNKKNKKRREKKRKKKSPVSAGHLVAHFSCLSRILFLPKSW